ncbi:lipoprotein signal peptidase [Segetibacter sp. 3557_3]|nr:lipoprotein signal peptidase [Segetibacter sp. 3557_3]
MGAKPVKPVKIVLFVLVLLFIDQAVKLYIKTHYYLGEEIRVFGQSWFRLHFVENEGMAWGWKWGGEWGKVVLTLFRLVAVIAGTFIIRNFIRKQYHRGFILCASLIYAGALGNLIDSMFYGLIFQESDPYIQNVAKVVPVGQGYAGFLHGKVVDMLYFPIVSNARYPEWFPFWGGEDFEFFRPVFNIADACISIGVITILIFQNRFFNKQTEERHTTVETNAPVDDNVQVQ